MLYEYSEVEYTPPSSSPPYLVVQSQFNRFCLIMSSSISILFESMEELLIDWSFLTKTSEDCFLLGDFLSEEGTL